MHARTKHRIDGVRRGRGLRFAAATAAVTVVATALVAGAATGAGAATVSPKGYLALGDSYATGQGIGGTVGSDPDCLQSPVSYPAQVAANLGLTLMDHTCSGAVLDDLFNTSSSGRAPQADAPAASIGLITLSIGGNDLGFRQELTNCLAISASGPLTGGQASCQAKFTAGGADRMIARVTDEVTPKFASAVTKLRSAFPDARILVVGYLPLMPDTAHTPQGGCFAKLTFQGTSYPFVTSDLEWINSVQRAMDAQFDRAAEAAGVEYLSQMATAADHSSCSAAGSPYVAPLTINGLSGATPTSLHPTEAGLQFEGQNVTSALSTRDAFQGIRGQLLPQGGDQYELQIVVPNEVAAAMPDIAATKNASYIGNVKGGSGYYLSKRVGPASTVYSQQLAVGVRDVVELRVYQNGTRQVLTQLPASFQGVTGQLVHTSGNTYELQIWVPANTLLTTPDVSARINGRYSANVAAQRGFYLGVADAPGYRVYHQTVTVDDGDIVDLNVTGTGEKQTLS